MWYAPLKYYFRIRFCVYSVERKFCYIKIVIIKKSDDTLTVLYFGSDMWMSHWLGEVDDIIMTDLSLIDILLNSEQVQHTMKQYLCPDRNMAYESEFIVPGHLQSMYKQREGSANLQQITKNTQNPNFGWVLLHLHLLDITISIEKIECGEYWGRNVGKVFYHCENSIAIVSSELKINFRGFLLICRVCFVESFKMWKETGRPTYSSRWLKMKVERGMKCYKKCLSVLFL